MIDPGQLRTRLVLQQPIETPDDQGGVTRAWSSYGNAWAKIVPLAAQPGVEADASGATQNYRIIMRASFSLMLQHRLVEGAKVYRIVAIRESDDRRFIEIDAQLRIE
jgi:SPP1 family predicted phage head-tail adaptor